MVALYVGLRCPKSLAGLVVVASLAAMTSSASAVAGPEEAWSYRHFWVIKPYAMAWSTEDPKDATLYVGYDAPWFAALVVPGGIMPAPGTFEWRIPHVKAYSTRKWLIYGSTWDGRWFLVDVAGETLQRYTDMESWGKAVADAGGPKQPTLDSLEDGYWASMRSLWFWRAVKGVAILVICSIPWLVILPFLKRRWLRRGRAAQTGGASAPVASPS